MRHIVPLAKTKLRKLALVGGGLLMAVVPLGVSAATSANAYTGNTYQGSHYNTYSHSRNYHHSYVVVRTYSSYRWVFDPYLHRWVLIGWNTHRNCWELTNDHDRYDSHRNDRHYDRNYGYWYNN